jgi:chain length determinant protein tyrosine kinase EpsG
MGSIFKFLGRRKNAPETSDLAPVSGQAFTASADTLPVAAAAATLPDRPDVAAPGEPAVPPAAAAKPEVTFDALTPLKAPPVVPTVRRVAIDSAEETRFAHTQFLGHGNSLIGELLQQQGLLTAENIERVLAYQRETRARFGEAAVALGLVRGPDVLRALSLQFGYDYAPVTATQDAESFSDELVVARHPFSRAAETIRDLRSELLSGPLSPDAAGHPALAVVSLDNGDGKTWLAANLAVSLSQLGAKTLLVDANLRNPRVHEIFRVDEPRGGLSGILMRNRRAEVLKPSRSLPNLHILPAGPVPPNPLETLQARGFMDLMHKLRQGFTHVIVDTPAASAGADARLVAARCGASVLVARKHKSAMGPLKDFAQLLGKGNAQFAGLVVNEI